MHVHKAPINLESFRSLLRIIEEKKQAEKKIITTTSTTTTLALELNHALDHERGRKVE
jgi:hypothetical protein